MSLLLVVIRMFRHHRKKDILVYRSDFNAEVTSDSSYKISRNISLLI